MQIRKCIFLTCAASLSYAFCVPAVAQSGDSSVRIIHKTTNFNIKGDGSEQNWAGEDWLALPQRMTAGANYQTKIKVLYSDSGIYCLYHCEDRKITSTLQEDFADLYNEDVVEAFFWPDENVPIYFEYELSPLNHELPILVPNLNGNFLGWRPWHYEGRRLTRHATFIEQQNDSVRSWTAEFYIPFALLKPLTNVPPQKDTRWRANFYRIDYDEGISEWSWQLTRKTFHDYEKFGTIVFD